MGPIFFVHIPKTAGTSFRLGAEEFFGKQPICYDYGKSAAETSELVRETLYAGPQADLWHFREQCLAQRLAMVGGHVSSMKFVALFGIANTLTFLREPLQRMASEYGHFVRKHAYEGSFRDFYSSPAMQNRQSRLLRGTPLSSLGLVGITERYEESLELVNATYGTKIPVRQDNFGKPSIEAQHEISAEDEKELLRLNKADLVLYRAAMALHESRLEMHRDGLPFAHAGINQALPRQVSGWAWWAQPSRRKEPMTIDILVNEEHRGTVKTLDLRSGLCRLLPPRGGYVGFRLAGHFKPGDLVQCRVVETGQLFPPRPRKVRRPSK
jgi:hypothetical protein